MRSKWHVTFQMKEGKAGDRGEKQKHEDQEPLEDKSSWVQSKFSKVDLQNWFMRVFCNQKSQSAGVLTKERLLHAPDTEIMIVASCQRWVGYSNE